MKKTFSKFASLILFAALIVAPIAGCTGGCKSATTAAYKTSGVTHVGVTAGMRSWNQYLVNKDSELNALALTEPVKAEKERVKVADRVEQVRVAYEKYQASQLAVLNAAQAFHNLPVEDPAKPEAQDRLGAAIAAASITLGDVMELLKKFGVVK